VQLEGEIVKLKKQEAVYAQAMETLQADLDALEQENTQLKRQGRRPGDKATASGVGASGGTSAGVGRAGGAPAPIATSGRAGAGMGDGVAPASDGSDGAAGGSADPAVVVALRRALQHQREENAHLRGRLALVHMTSLAPLPTQRPPDARAAAVAALRADSRQLLRGAPSLRDLCVRVFFFFWFVYV
jgi:hypothetical protein